MLKIIANELHVSLSDFFKGPGDVTVLTDTSYKEDGNGITPRTSKV